MPAPAHILSLIYSHLLQAGAAIVGAVSPLQSPPSHEAKGPALCYEIKVVYSHVLQAGAAIVGAASIVYAPHAPQPPSPSASPTASGLGELGGAAEALSQLWSHWNPVTRAGLVSNLGTEGKGAYAGASQVYYL